jgi:hypothetical protein
MAGDEAEEIADIAVIATESPTARVIAVIAVIGWGSACVIRQLNKFQGTCFSDSVRFRCDSGDL